ncbi:MAG TPA: hypothetical protein VMU66_03310 [Gaiellales bacterium]|nr:hypothetical protein [Gaiellales bacterium]
MFRARSWRERLVSAAGGAAVGVLVPLLTLDSKVAARALIGWEAVPFLLLGLCAFVLTSRTATLTGLGAAPGLTWAGNASIQSGSASAAAVGYVVLPVLLTVGVVTWVLADLALAMARGGLAARRTGR